MAPTQVGQTIQDEKSIHDSHDIQIKSSVVAEPELEVRIHWGTIAVLISINFLFFCQLVAIVGSGILAQTIGQRFNAATQTVWPGSVINILTFALAPSVSQAADLWGRKIPLLFFTLLGLVGAIIISRAQNMATVLAGFCVLGSCFGSQPLLHAVVSEIVPRKHRPLAQAGVNIFAGLGGITGLMVGGSLLRHEKLENYRIYYYVSAAIYVLAFSGVFIFYNPPPREEQARQTNGEKLKTLDWIGNMLFVPGLVLFCVALSWSENPYSWTNAHILAPFIVGCVLIIAFVIYEWRFRSDGILHHGLFPDRNFPLACVCISVEGLAFFAANAYYPFEVALFTGADLLESAGHFSLTFVASIVATFVAGWYSTRFRATRAPIVFGFAMIAVFYIIMITRNPSSPTAVYWVFPCILGIGIGVLLPSLIVVAQLSTPARLISIASGLLIGTRGLGSTIGLTVNNAIFNGRLSTELPNKIAAAVLPLGLPASSLPILIPALALGNQTALALVPGTSPEIIGAGAQGMLQAYSLAFRGVWIAALAFTLVCLIAASFLYDPRDEYTAHIDAPAEAEVAEVQARLEGALRVPVDGNQTA